MPPPDLRPPLRASAEAVYARTRIVKRLAASQHGAIKWARRYGDALVCVRYRHDAEASRRYTTVELVVDEAPIASRRRIDPTVMVRIATDERKLQQLASAHGARWDSRLRVWLMPRTLAKDLRLLSRIVRT
jgi:uncharacterized protein YqiB (DUF1249 family)